MAEKLIPAVSSQKKLKSNKEKSAAATCPDELRRSFCLFSDNGKELLLRQTIHLLLQQLFVH